MAAASRQGSENVRSDEELISEIRGGSHGALDLLVRRHYGSVYSYAARKIGDPHLAYDITQEVFVRMLKGLAGYKQETGNYMGWLMGIAVNTCRNYFRSSLHSHRDNEVELEDSLHSPVNVVYLVEKRAEQKEITAALMELPEFQREVIILKIYHGFKFGEIAEITGSSEATAKSRFRQGIGKLRNGLEERREEDDRRDERTAGKKSGR